MTWQTVFATLEIWLNDASLMEEVLRDVDPRQQDGRYYVSPHQGAYFWNRAQALLASDDS